MTVIAELTKIRTVRSTVWTLLAALVVCVGLSVLFGSIFRRSFADLPQAQQDRFDPLFATFYSVTFGQLAMVVFAVVVMAGEYSSGTIRATLVAVPRRGVFYTAKILAVALVVGAASVVIVLATFVTAQAALGPHATALGAAGVWGAVVGTCFYLVFISLFALGVAAMLRNSVAALAILLPVLFLGSQGLGNVPKLKTVTQYFPDQAGAVIMHLTGPADDPRFGRPYGPWTGLGILALWTVAALVGGFLVLRHQDA